MPKVETFERANRYMVEAHESGAATEAEAEAFLPTAAAEPRGSARRLLSPARVGVLALACGLCLSGLVAMGQGRAHRTPRSSGLDGTGVVTFLDVSDGSVNATSGAGGVVGNPYKCGSPLLSENKSVFVKGEYEAWKAKWVRDVEGGKCIPRPKGDVSGNPEHENDCVSEGNGYGLILSAYMGDRETFDGLWAFWQKYKDDQGNMHWQITPEEDEAVAGKGSATDVDEDGALALLVAAEKWGGKYKDLVREQIDRVWQNDVDKDKYLWKAGDGWGDCSTIDTSYFAPAWYKTFGKATGNLDGWEKVISFGFDFLGTCNEKTGGTGLAPQWTDCDCEKSLDIGKYPDQYWCDVSRLPWRMAVHAAWHCDEGAQKQADLLAKFFGKIGAANIENGYSLDGKPLHTKDTDNACTENCFVTMAAAAFVVGTDVDEETKVSFWEESAKKPKQSCYYCDALRVLSLLFTSGMMPEPQIEL